MIGRSAIELSSLKPTQLTVGMLEVKHKRERLRALAKRPADLVDFILEHPVRVVMGPKKKVYVIDHHHLALALIKEEFEVVPMQVEADFSNLAVAMFWKKMRALDFIHCYDVDGKRTSIDDIPRSLTSLADDPYRSLVGFVREGGDIKKVPVPFAEFQWADFYRTRIKSKMLSKHFDKALKQARVFAHHPEARGLPGYIRTPAK